MNIEALLGRLTPEETEELARDEAFYRVIIAVAQELGADQELKEAL